MSIPVRRFPRGWRNDPKVMVVVREHARGEHTQIRLDCPVCRRFPPAGDRGAS